MQPRALLLLLLALSGTFDTVRAFRHVPRALLHRLVIQSIRGGANKAQQRAAGKEMGFLSGHATALFNSADTNKDGCISPSEVYELVLKFYVKVNQQAPIPPPSRERVMYLFMQADKDRGGRLDIDEFQRLLRTIYARASSRVLVFKLVSMLVAPATAVSLVHIIEDLPDLMNLFDSIIPESTPRFLVKLLRRESVWVTIFTLLLVGRLGKLALGVVDWLWWGNNPDDKYYGDCQTLKEKTASD